jgi:hypothetical protein
MKVTTNDRELVCIFMALSGAQPETSHSNRKRKNRAFDQLDLERIEGMALPGGTRNQIPYTQWPIEDVVVDIEAGTKDYLLEKYGAEGTVAGGAFVERVVCRFIDRLRAAEDEKK